MFAIVDIETCGGKFAYQHGRIIDICIIVHDGLQVVDKFSTLINPDCHIGSFYTKLSGITNEMVKDAPRFHEIAKEILHYTEGKIFVAHNSAFDYNFIKAEFASLGYNFRRDTLCTVRLSRKLIPGKRSYSLGNLCESLGIVIHDRHRAEGDAVATAKLLDILLQLKTQSPTYKSAKVEQIMTSRVDNIKRYILNKLPESCGVYYFLDKDQNIIYIGKSKNMYQRAISHFNNDQKKAKEMLQNLYNVDFVETGSELLALLKESEEIKKHKPRFNHMRKADQFSHSIDCIEEDGVIQFRIVPYETSTACLLAFTSYASARERLEMWIDEKQLCLQYCGLTDAGSVCFNHQIKKCHGICAGLEEAEDYNRRAEQIRHEMAYPNHHFILFDRGRTHEEEAFIYIRNGKFAGYGYLPHDIQISDIAELQSYMESKTYYPDADLLVKVWLRQNEKVKLKVLD
ncbi:MAG: GIY-YIG nuclease family protein [Chitinophagaceae bacterium]|nr:GIY-YIG nuclease family protein [Chitinophagaceae bacterium]